MGGHARSSAGGGAMSEPAKDEFDLLRLAGEAIRQTLIKPPYCMEGTGCELPPCGCSQEAGKAALAAIRKAGWEVAPQTELDALRTKNARMRAAIHLNTDLNAVRAALKGQL